jgi:nucleoside 2-deoxyribosyltransferase
MNESIPTKSVVISGSTKFYKEMHEWIQILQDNKIKVFYPADIQFQQLEQKDLEKEIARVKFDYFQKIQKGDVVLLFNVGGYAGISTTVELGYATAYSKPILSIEEDPEISRKILIEKQVKTPEELIDYLRK